MSIYKNAFINGIIRVFTLPRLSIPLIITLGLTLGAVLTVVSISSTLLYQPLKGVYEEDTIKSLTLDLKVNDSMTPSFWKINRLAHFQQSYQDLGTWGAINSNRGNIVINNVNFGITSINASNTILDVLGTKLIKGDGTNIANPQEYLWISNSLWLQAFDGDDSAIGQNIQYNNRSYIIAGVIEDLMAIESNSAILEQQVWSIQDLATAIANTDDGQIDNEFESILVKVNNPTASYSNKEQVVGWMKTFVNEKITDSARFMDLINRQEKIVSFDGYRDKLLGDNQTLLAVLGAAVIGLLIMATLNLLNLFIAHYQSRTKELSMQITLGASLLRVRLMVICENLPSFLLAGALGLLLTAWLLKSLPIIAANSLPMIEMMSIDGPTLLFALFTLIILSVLFSQLALIDVDKKSLINNLSASGKGTNNQQNQWISNALMIVQLAIASVLLTASIMLATQSYQAVYKPLGYDYGNSYEVMFDVNDREISRQLRDYENYYGSQSQLLNQGLADAIEKTIPDAKVTITGNGPLNGAMRIGAFNHKNDPNNMLLFFRKGLSIDFFSAYGIEFVAGANLSQQQIENNEQTVVIDEAMAQSLFPGVSYQQILGKNIVGLNRDRTRPDPIINGIVKNTTPVAGQVEGYDLGSVYFNDLGAGRRITLSVMLPEGKVLSAAMVANIHSQFEGLDQAEVRSVEDIWQQQTLNQRISLLIILTMTVLTMLLAAIGVAGLTQMTTFHRKYELAIRMATGASQKKLLLFIVKDASKVLIAGLGLGFITAVFIYQYVTTQIDLLPSFNWLTMTGLDGALIAIVMLSVIWPAWQVIRNDPMQSLREE